MGIYINVSLHTHYIQRVRISVVLHLTDSVSFLGGHYLGTISCQSFRGKQILPVKRVEKMHKDALFALTIGKSITQCHSL